MRVFILGGGSVTTEYYLPALRSMGQLGNATVVDPDARSIKSLQGVVEFCAQDYVSFLNTLAPPKKDELSCIIVAVPNQFHVDAVRLALEKQLHVLCEKPLALTTLDCSRLRILAAEKRCALKVAMSRRYLPSLMLARDIVAAEELGKVRAIEVHDCTPFLWRPRSFAFFSPDAGGVLADMGVHYLDYLQTVVGELNPLAYSDDAKGGTELSLTYSLATDDVRVDMQLSRIRQSGAYIKIRCERGEILVDKANENEVIVTPLASQSRRVSGKDPFDDPTWPKNFQGSFCQMLADFRRAIDGHVTRIADVSDAERVAALVEWAYGQPSRGTPIVPMPSAQSFDRTKVLVTGGTGFIGGHLVERLSAGANDIRVAARTPGKCANVSRFPVAITSTDLLDMNSVRAAVNGARYVYHLAYGQDGRNPASITIAGTKNVVEAAIEAGADSVVVLSTMYVFGFPRSASAVDELFPYQPFGGEYGRSKAIMERWCLARAQSSLPTRIVILNPTCVFGPGGGAYTSLPVDLARQGRFCWINDGTGLCNYSYVENLIDAIIKAAQVPQAHGNRFIINDGTVSWREFLEPMIQPFAHNGIPSFTPEQLRGLPRYGSPFSMLDLVSAAISAPRVRDAAKRSKTIRYLSSLTRSMRSANTVSSGGSLQGEAGGFEYRYPPEWLADLYGPARTSFSAKKANDVLRWRPVVNWADALRRTVTWLAENSPNT